MPRIIGVTVLLAAVAVGAVLVFDRPGDDIGGSSGNNLAQDHMVTPTHGRTPAIAPTAPRMRLSGLTGRHTATVGRTTDKGAGLAYPRLGQPWKAAPAVITGAPVSGVTAAQNVAGGTGDLGWLASARLAGTALSYYTGTGSVTPEQNAVDEVWRLFDASAYPFAHEEQEIASQPFSVGSHNGWLLGYRVAYHRAGVKSTGDVVAVAVVDTGHGAPGILFMSVPDTHPRLDADIPFVLRSLRVRG
jgi:hypothetical protein